MTNTNTNDPGEAAVPAGYRLGDGWELALNQFSCTGCDATARYDEFGGRSACGDCAVEMGALVPIDPPVAVPPGFRVVGRSGPDVPLPTVGSWVRFARYPGEPDDGIVDPPRRVTLRDGDPFKERWCEGCFDILEPIPAAPVAEPGARCRVCGHYETSLARATERYAHCPACGRAPHWILVGDGDVRASVPPVAEPPARLTSGEWTVTRILGNEPLWQAIGPWRESEEEARRDAEHGSMRGSLGPVPSPRRRDFYEMVKDAGPLPTTAMASAESPPGPVPPEGEPGDLRFNPFSNRASRRALAVADAPAAAPAKAPLSTRDAVFERIRGELLSGAAEPARREQAVREVAEEISLLITQWSDESHEVAALSGQLTAAIRERDEQRGRAERAERALQEQTARADKAEARERRAEERAGKWYVAAMNAGHAHPVASKFDRRMEIAQREADARVAEARRTGWADAAKATREAVRRGAIDAVDCRKIGCLGLSVSARYACAGIDGWEHSDVCGLAMSVAALALTDAGHRLDALPLPVCPEGPPATKGSE